MDKISSYETLFIVDVQQGEEGIKALVDKFTGLIAASGTVESVDEWGKRKLAYPINDKNEGYYVVATFKAEAGVPVELDRNYNIDENIMRSMIVKLEFEAVKHEAPAAVDAPAAEAAPAVEEAPADAE